MSPEERQELRDRESAEFGRLADAVLASQEAVPRERERVAFAAERYVDALVACQQGKGSSGLVGYYLGELHEAVGRMRGAEATSTHALNAMIAFKRTV